MAPQETILILLYDGFMTKMKFATTIPRDDVKSVIFTYIKVVFFIQ